MPRAVSLALAMGASRRTLDPGLQGLLTAPTAWTLAILLASWRSGGNDDGLDMSRYPEFAGAFEMYGGVLSRFIDTAASARDPIELASAGGLFVAALKQIGVGTIKGVVDSQRFRSVQTEVLARYPMPAEVAAAFNGMAPAQAPRAEVDRTRQFDSFDYRRPSNAAPAAPSVSVEQLASWRRELNRADISPEMRWFYEQKMVSAKQIAYSNPADARAAWQAMLAGPLHAELRQYFSENLRSLDARTVAKS